MTTATSIPIGSAINGNVYSWRTQVVPGITTLDAQEVGDRVELLSEAHPEGVSPKTLIEDSRDPSSPLNNYFEWDDRIAADRHRIVQAQKLLANLAQRSATNPDKAVRSFANVSFKRGEATYQPFAEVVNNPIILGRLVERAVKSLHDAGQVLAELEGARAEEYAPIREAFRAAEDTVVRHELDRALS